MLTPFVASVVIILLVSQGFFGKLPTFDELENPKTNLATQLISSDGNNLGAYFYENRSNVSYKELPNDLIDALIATEDIRFRNHSGIDIRSLLRAVYGQIIGNKSIGRVLAVIILGAPCLRKITKKIEKNVKLNVLTIFC